MSYRKYLTRYGSSAETGEIRFSIYLTDPAKLTTPKDIIWRDKHIAEDITRLESVLEALRDYRKDLAARYAQLETMPYAERVELERYPSSTRGIQYYIRIVRRYEDGSEVNQLSETYDGKQRHIALKRFAEIQKQRPGIKAIKDIERRSWER